MSLAMYLDPGPSPYCRECRYIYPHPLTATATVTLDQTLAMAQTAVDNLNTFYVVGVVEQYKGFIEVLKRSLDPTEEHPELWQAAVRVKDNGYAVSKPLV